MESDQTSRGPDNGLSLSRNSVTEKKMIQWQNMKLDTRHSQVKCKMYREKKGWKTYEGIRTAKSQTDNEQGCRQNHFNFVPTFYFKLRSHTVSHLLQP